MVRPQVKPKVSPKVKSYVGLNRWIWSFTLVVVMSCLSLISATAAWAAPERIPLKTAQADILRTDDPSVVLGVAQFIEMPDGVQIRATLRGAPEGYHGFHIHVGKSCAWEGKAAGSHFNPDQVQHGRLVSDGFAKAHAGDLGNIGVGATGLGILSIQVPGLTLTEGKYAIADHSLILHANPDDFSQPVGNAGSRIGCGLIQMASEELGAEPSPTAEVESVDTSPEPAADTNPAP